MLSATVRLTSVLILFPLFGASCSTRSRDDVSLPPSGAAPLVEAPAEPRSRRCTLEDPGVWDGGAFLLQIHGTGHVSEARPTTSHDVTTPGLRVEHPDGGVPDVEATGLPALSEDGQSLAYEAHLNVLDQYYYRPNFALVVRNVSEDKVTKQLDLLRVDESDRPYRPALIHELQRRLARAKELLIRGTFREIPISSSVEHASEACKSNAPEIVEVLDCFEIEYRDTHLRIVGDQGSVLLDRQFTTWSAPTTPACQGRNKSYLQGFALEPARRILVLSLGYCGDLGCPPPPTESHALVIADMPGPRH